MRYKKTLILLAAVLFTWGCKAPVIEYTLGNTPRHLPSDNYYVKDNNNYYNAVLGNWKTDDSNSIFEMTIVKFVRDSYFGDNRFSDNLFGKYKYTQNGRVISEIEQIEPFPNVKLVFNYETPTKFRVVIKDVISDTNKIGEFILTSPTTAEMRLWNSEGVKINYGNGQPWALPTYFEFTKQ